VAVDGGVPAGTNIGAYIVESPLGRGGMGIVYRAYHPRLQRWAAIKLLPPFGNTEEARQRFEREARAVARLRHRNILSVFDFGDFNGQPYMVTEYMPNGSLQERLPKEPLAPDQAIELLRPLAAALDYAHDQGIVHRDVKPANVFLDGEWQPVLADFGLAKMYSEESITMSGTVSGTPSHMAPEQARGSDPTGKADLYALAVIAFQLLTGRLPFTGASVMDILYQHVNEPPPEPSRLNPSLTPAIDTVITRGLAKDPTERWPTCEAMVGALEAAARPPEVEATMVAPLAASPLQPAEQHGGVRRVLLTGLGAAVVIALAGLGVLYTLGKVEPPSGIAISPPGLPSPAISPVVPARHLSVQPAPPLVIGSTVTVAGDGLDPKRTASVGILQGDVVHPLATGVQVKADGTYSVSGVVPKDLQTGSGTLVACNFDNAGQSDPLSRCAQLSVSIRK
jgi:serine/threonine-protein kinase